MTRAAARVMLAAGILVSSLVAAQAGERDQLNACKAMVTRSEKALAVSDEAALARCRQIIKEWVWRDARRSVDENGRPLK